MTETLSPTTEQVDTREALLDAAESLFSELGIQASSLRAITQRAGANLAAVHYHFGSKEGLVRAVFSRRLKPLNEQRLRLLEACDLTADDAVEQVLNAFLSPLLRMSRETPEGVRDFARLMGRAYMEPSEEVREMLLEEIGEVVRRFTEALGRILSPLPGQELLWRLHFVAGAMGHTVACSHALEKHSHGLCQPSNPDEALRFMIPFLAAGLRAGTTP
ncbi:MAG TPA: TetR family transcriptional regulator [Thermoanaerobaculia bacterium]|nr:TetR family transcriptional regulator [Thermoanaerobaculia bacterium]